MITAEIPKQAVLYRQGKYTYVYYVTERSYNKEKQYSESRRVCIGRLLEDGRMRPNENYYAYHSCFDHEAAEVFTSDVYKIGVSLLIDQMIDSMPGIQDLFSLEERQCLKDMAGYAAVQNRYADYRDYAFEHFTITKEPLTLPAGKLKQLLRYQAVKTAMTGRRLLIVSGEDQPEYVLPLMSISDDGTVKPVEFILEHQTASGGLRAVLDRYDTCSNQMLVLFEKDPGKTIRNELKSRQMNYVICPDHRNRNAEKLIPFDKKAFHKVKDLQGLWYSSSQIGTNENLHVFYEMTQSGRGRAGNLHGFTLISDAATTAEEAVKAFDIGSVYRSGNHDGAFDRTVSCLLCILKSELYSKVRKDVLWSENYERHLMAVLEQLILTKSIRGTYSLIHAVTDQQNEILQAFGIDQKQINDYINRINRTLQAEG